MNRIEDNKAFLMDLFGGPFRGHALIAEPGGAMKHDWPNGDPACSPLPVRDWLPQVLNNYETLCAWHEATDDDGVPYAALWTGTEVLAAAFGCPVHYYEDNVPCALPLVSTAEEADRIPVPDLSTRPIERLFQLGALVIERLGPDVIIGVPDIQSPFDVAALIWDKEDLFLAMYQEPEAVKRLVEKCRLFITSFLNEFKRVFPNCNLCHCPRAWAPPEFGIWLSEDEAGAISAPMFDEFCLPSLAQLSRDFGGMFMHCCAAADHQYQEFRKIPNLRGLNRLFQEPGPMPAIEAFSGETVLMLSVDEPEANHLLDIALPDTRYLFNVGAGSIDEAKGIVERLRGRAPRTQPTAGSR